MAPRGVFRIQQAIISVLAGDLFRNTPVAVPLALFKAIFYLTFVLNFSRAWAAYRRRRQNVAVEFRGGTLPEDQRALGK